MEDKALPTTDPEQLAREINLATFIGRGVCIGGMWFDVVNGEGEFLTLRKSRLSNRTIKQLRNIDKKRRKVEMRRKKM